MSRRTRTLMTLALALVVTAPGVAAAAPAAVKPSPSTSLAQSQADLITAAGAASALVLTRYGDDLTAVASGVRASGSPVAARADDRFRAGSTTKSLVAAVVLQLAEEGRVDLDGPLAHHLPGILPYAQDVSVRQLLQHTSGVPDFVDEELIRALLDRPDLRWSPEQLVQKVEQTPRLEDRIGRFSYSNTNYVLLGLLVEKVTATSLDRVLTERVLKPAGMQHSSFPDSARIRGPHVHGYVPVGPGAQIDVTTTDPSWAWASGDMITTTADLARFYEALVTGVLLHAESLAVMQTTVPTGANPFEHYGLGLTRWDTPCGDAWGHTGSIPGYTTFVAGDSSGSKQVVVVAPFAVELAPEHPVTAAFFTSAFTAFCAA